MHVYADTCNYVHALGALVKGFPAAGRRQNPSRSKLVFVVNVKNHGTQQYHSFNHLLPVDAEAARRAREVELLIPTNGLPELYQLRSRGKRENEFAIPNEWLRHLSCPSG
jgi:hypothetical protein